ncbi:MAG TPA: glycosyltransferase family 4 protein [Myxococcota bacterium]|nr:glycosyltransferase family 4 protein [Myxococcota bacterium]
MKILHVTHDWKWTGPAEPMLRLCQALRERGHDAAIVCPEPPDRALRSLAGEARAAGFAPAATLSRERGPLGLGAAADVAVLSGALAADPPDLVHAWHTRDHLLAWRARRRLAPAARPRLVRSLRSAGRVPGAPWSRWLLGPGCDGLLCPSPETARAAARLRGGRPVAGHFGAVDARFFPKAPDPGVRAALGLSPEHRVVGIVARVQRQRRFDLLLEAARRLFEGVPEARLLVVGRGTHREALAEAPARALGIADRVVFAGYRDHDYAEVLRQIEVFTFLVPGSDGTCRALLEAAACAIPAVVSERGALPEIVLHRETGLVVPEDPAALAAAWRELLADPERRADLGRAAYERAQAEFTPARLGDRVESFYREVLAARAAAGA